MTRYEKWIEEQTLQKVAESYADDYECNCELCPIFDNWRECKAYNQKAVDYEKSFQMCIGLFSEWLSEEE